MVVTGTAETLQNVADSLQCLGASYLLTIGGDDTASGAAAVAQVLGEKLALACPRCGGRLRLIATVEDPDAIRTILAALALSEERADRAPPFAASPDTSHAAAIGA